MAPPGPWPGRIVKILHKWGQRVRDRARWRLPPACWPAPPSPILAVFWGSRNGSSMFVSALFGVFGAVLTGTARPYPLRILQIPPTGQRVLGAPVGVFNGVLAGAAWHHCGRNIGVPCAGAQSSASRSLAPPGPTRTLMWRSPTRAPAFRRSSGTPSALIRYPFDAPPGRFRT